MAINQGKIVSKDREKPCYELGWCPFNDITWSFKEDEDSSEYTCSIFSRHCPVFYLRVSVVEGSRELPTKSNELIEDFTDHFFRKEWFHREKEKYISKIHEKPCHQLGYCPYGELVYSLAKTESTDEIVCRLFNRTCPVFFLARNFSEKKFRRDGVSPIF
jgi:hypothetical protein